MNGTMPTGEPKARYTLPHTTETGRIRTASSTRSDFLWRSSWSSSGPTPIRASRAAQLSIQAVMARARVTETRPWFPRSRAGELDEHHGDRLGCRPVAGRLPPSSRAGLQHLHGRIFTRFRWRRQAIRAVSAAPTEPRMDKAPGRAAPDAAFRQPAHECVATANPPQEERADRWTNQPQSMRYASSSPWSASGPSRRNGL